VRVPSLRGRGGCGNDGCGNGTGLIFAGTGGDGCDGLHPCSSLEPTEHARRGLASVSRESVDGFKLTSVTD